MVVILTFNLRAAYDNDFSRLEEREEILYKYRTTIYFIGFMIL